MEHRNMASERVRIGVTQRQMAEKLGVSESTLVRYERNNDIIPPAILKKSAEIFGCSVNYLLDLTEERM